MLHKNICSAKDTSKKAGKCTCTCTCTVTCTKKKHSKLYLHNNQAHKEVHLQLKGKRKNVAPHLNLHLHLHLHMHSAHAHAHATALAHARLTTPGVRTAAQCSTVPARHNNLRWTMTGDSNESLQRDWGCVRLRYEQLGTWRPHETTSLRIEIPRHVYDRPLRTPRDHETWLRDALLRVRRAPGGPRDQYQNETVKLQLYSDTKAMA